MTDGRFTEGAMKLGAHPRPDATALTVALSLDGGGPMGVLIDRLSATLAGGQKSATPASAPEESKSFDVLPEGIWQQLLAAQDMSGGLGLESAVGLPAVLAVIRFLSHAAGMVPMNVVSTADGDVQQRATGTWQWNLINRRPAPPPTTPFNFQADLAANFCGRGNAYVRKYKPTTYAQRFKGGTPRVMQLKSLNAAQVMPKLTNTDALVFTDSTGSTPIDRTTGDIIQIRSMSVGGDGLTGVSPITAARQLVTAGLKRNVFEDRHLASGISPSLAVNFPRGMTEGQASQWLDFIESRHAGVGKAGKAIGVPDGAKITALPISLADALFADMTNLTIAQVCAMYQIPLALMYPSPRPTVTDDDYRFFVTWALGPVLTAISQAYQADDDLFMPGEDDDLSVSPESDALLKLDPLKKAQVYQAQIQSGQRLVDETRAADGYGPLPPIPDDWKDHPGQIPQITPVGGAPNPQINTDAGVPVPTPGLEE